MVCEKCGSNVELGEKFCPNCGAEIVIKNNNASQNNFYSPQIKKANSNLFKIGIVLQGLVGCAFIVSSFYTNYEYGRWFSSNGYSAGNPVTYSYYGGDAYTGIQQAAAQTATNVNELSKISLYGFELTANNVGQFSWVFIQFAHIVLVLVGTLLIVKSIKEFGKLKFEENKYGL